MNKENWANILNGNILKKLSNLKPFPVLINYRLGIFCWKFKIARIYFTWMWSPTSVVKWATHNTIQISWFWKSWLEHKVFPSRFNDKIANKLIHYNNKNPLTHHSPVLLFCTPWKHQKTFRFYVFRRYRKATLGCNGLNSLLNALACHMLIEIEDNKVMLIFCCS